MSTPKSGPSSLPPPADLACEHLREPLGVDADRPRLSFTPAGDGRGIRIASVRVVVSSAPDGPPDVWDSGDVATDRPWLDYGGPALAGATAYFWRARWRDAAGRESAWSAPASFLTGLLDPADRRGGWITMSDPLHFTSRGTVILGVDRGDMVQCHGIYLRKEFVLDAPVRRATAFVCGAGYFVLRLNGARVGDTVLEPAQSDWRKIGLYSTFDVTGLLSARNAVVAILGNGRHIRMFGHDDPRLFLRIEVEFADRRRCRVVADPSFRASHGPLMENGLYYGERYDARREMPGFDRPGFDDSAWRPAVACDGPPVASRAMPPVRPVETLAPQRIGSPAPGVFVFDFGKNVSGFTRLRARGPAGTEIRLRHAELLNEDGSLNVATNDRAEATDVYVLAGRGEEEWEPSFTYHGFRFVEVTGFPGTPGPNSLVALFVHSDLPRTGSFFCGDPLANEIHECVVRGQLSNFVSFPTDCPQRDERHGWLGDAQLAAEEAAFNFDVAAFFARYLRDIRLAQREDGALPDVVPPYWRHLYPADPAWGSAYAQLAWLVYEWYGDERVLAEHFDGVRAYVEFLRAKSEGGIARGLGKYGDWCPPGSIASKKTPVELVATFHAALDTRILSRMAAALGRPEDGARYDALADGTVAAFHREFYRDGQYATFRNGPVDREPSQTANALALALGAVPEADREKVFAGLVRSAVVYHDSHLDTGIVGTRYLFPVLADGGRADLAWRIATQRTYPGFGYMVAEGATTLWERWEKLAGGGMNSHNHIMFGSVDAWFYRAVAGLSPAAPGWRRIRVAPHPIPALPRAEASVATPFGPAAVAWRREGAGFSLDATIPAGTEAEFALPLPAPDAAIRESGVVVWPAPDPRGEVRAAGAAAGVVRLETGSGAYRFEVRSPGA